jgi:ABC-type siderophore export system fused ATPase/permease subunit
MTVRLEMKPKTLAARLLVQSLKLARNKLNRRYRKRVAEFVDLLENRQSQTA